MADLWPCRIMQTWGYCFTAQICSEHMATGRPRSPGRSSKTWQQEFKQASAPQERTMFGDLYGKETRRKGLRAMHSSGRLRKKVVRSLKKTAGLVSPILGRFARGKGLHTG